MNSIIIYLQRSKAYNFLQHTLLHRQTDINIQQLSIYQSIILAKKTDIPVV